MERVHLFLAVTNRQVALPGACTSKNDWTLPGDWEVQRIFGRLLVFVVYDQDTDDKTLEKDDAGKIRNTEAPVSAVFTRHGEIADPACPLHLCSVDGTVQVLLGDEVLPFAGLADAWTAPLIDLTEVLTPPTPKE